MSDALSKFQFSPIGRQPEDFQRPLTAEQIGLLYRHTFGSNGHIALVNELASGHFNNTYLIQVRGGDRIILRVGPDPSAEVFTHEKDLLRREPLLGPHLAVIGHLVPQVIRADFSRQLINRDYIFQQFLAGELWDEVQEELSSEDSVALWSELAAIARQIHSVTGSAFGYPYPQAEHDRWSDAVIDIATMMRKNLLALNLDAGGTVPYIEMLDAGRCWLDEIATPRLLHGDLWPKNVLIDRSTSSPRIVGLLDAERGMWGDPLAEWIFYYLDVPVSFWNTYGHPQQDTGTLFRLLAYRGMYAIQVLLEASRFDWDPRPQRARLVESTRAMKSLPPMVARERKRGI